MAFLRFGLLVALAVIFSSVAFGQTSIVSVSNSGGTADNDSTWPAISSDGRYVAFMSTASNLVPGDANGRPDIFVRDTQTGQVEIVSVSSSGVQQNNACGSPSISADGRFIAFGCNATNLIAGFGNGAFNVFVHDRQTGVTEIVSKSISSGQANGDSSVPAISSDGRYVVFDSFASDIVANDTNNLRDVFIHDRQSGLTERVSVSTVGSQAMGGSSFEASISADGRFVTFISYATNLIPGGTTPNRHNVYVRDRQIGQTEIVSVSSSGVHQDKDSYNARISADGRYVAFGSSSTNLVPGDLNAKDDVFVRDLQTGITEMVSVSSSAEKGNNGSGYPSISSDGRYVAFYSIATNLSPADLNATADVFIRDRMAGLTEVVSVSSAGVLGNNSSYDPVISADGRYVAFPSFATNLVFGDTNIFIDIFVHRAPFPLNLPIPYGVGTPGCQGPHVLSGSNTANIGNANFTLKCTNAPVNSLGGWFITDSQDIPGTDAFSVGVLLHVDFFNATEAFVIDSYSDAAGLGTLTIAVPNNPVLIGKTFYA